MENSAWLIWSDAGPGFIKPAPPCLQAILWHSKEGVGFTDNTCVKRQQEGFMYCPLAQDLSAGHVTWVEQRRRADNSVV